MKQKFLHPTIMRVQNLFTQENQDGQIGKMGYLTSKISKLLEISL